MIPVTIELRVPQWGTFRRKLETEEFVVEMKGSVQVEVSPGTFFPASFVSCCPGGGVKNLSPSFVLSSPFNHEMIYNHLMLPKSGWKFQVFDRIEVAI